MDVSAIKSQVSAGDVPLERLAGNSSVSENEKIGEVSRQFEAMLLRNILQNSQKTVIKSKYSDDSASAGIYRDMLTTNLADSISKSGALQLAKTLEHQLTRQVHPTSSAGNNTESVASPSALLQSGGARPNLYITHPGEHHGNSRSQGLRGAAEISAGK